MTDLFSLEGRRALVTGASRGIGRAIALAFAGAGADVAVAARSAEDLARVAGEIGALGRRSVVVPCDVRDSGAIEHVVDETLGSFETIDVLVNNAGGPVFNAPFVEIRPEGWMRILELNLMSVVHFCRAVGPHMLERGRGSVINVDSIGASHPAPLVTPYCAAKAAVVNLTQALALEWASSGVRVNALSPGMIDTEINRRLVDDPNAGPGLAGRIPLGRWGTPDDLVGAALWLASDASSYITGAHIPVNGGLGVVAPQSFADLV